MSPTWHDVSGGATMDDEGVDFISLPIDTHSQTQPHSQSTPPNSGTPMTTTCPSKSPLQKGKEKGGRESILAKLSFEQYQQMLTYINAGATQFIAAESIGVSQGTFHRMDA